MNLENQLFAPSTWIVVAFPSGYAEVLTYHLNSEQKAKLGQIVEVTVRRRKTWGIVVEISQNKPTFKTIAPLAIIPFFLSEERFSFLKWLSEYYLCPWNYVLEVVFPTKFASWLLEKSEKITGKNVRKVNSWKPLIPPVLNEEQAIACAEITKSIQNKEFTSFLLWGITGSGKTRVYIEIAKNTLLVGKNILILVPEINLTPQTQNQFQALLNQKVEIQHSGITPVQKEKLWRKLFKNEVKILMGTRSALLAPLENIGLIIVDEEHDGSYKQEDPSPRYHARDSALFLGRLYNCPVVLGSATPSLETYQNALQKKHVLLKLTQKAAVSQKPSVKMIDLMEAYRKEGSNRLISRELREEMMKTLNQNEQVILLFNRRGFSTARLCTKCAVVHRCFDCSVATTYHKAENQMVCHSCARVYAPTQACACGSTDFLWEGSGIEKLEEEVQSWFPDFPCLRLDRDVATSPKKIEDELQKFRNKEYLILIGTQMIAKGHDFPEVTLAAVIQSDASLNLPDFRANERTFQLLSQVAGRSGRHKPGQVIFQAFNPQDPTLQFSLADHFENFASAELSLRQELNYPPFIRSALIEIRHLNAQKGHEWIHLLTQKLKSIYGQELGQVQIQGPVSAPRAQSHKYYRFHLFVKENSSARLHNHLKKMQEFVIEQRLKNKDLGELRIDIDPTHLM